MIKELKTRFSKALKHRIANPERELVFKPVYWAPVIQNAEDKLWNRMKRGGKMDFKHLRRFMVDFAADAIAYQPTPHDRHMYDGIHQVVAKSLKELAQKAGSKAPLYIIAHSLGTVVTSNYIYDLQVDQRRKTISESVRSVMGDTPLDRGETLTLLYTLGSPIVLWNLRYPEFGIPIKVPSPKIRTHYSQLGGEWVNFYDQDDVIGYPLKTINERYKKAVKEDKRVNAGGFLSSWNPASHTGYWTDNDVTKPITQALVKTWLTING